MSTEFYADYISKTTFDPESHSVKSKFNTPSSEVEVNEENEYGIGYNRKSVNHANKGLSLIKKSSLKVNHISNSQHDSGNTPGSKPHTKPDVTIHYERGDQPHRDSASGATFHTQTAKSHESAKHFKSAHEQIKEAATDVKKKPASKTPKMEIPATEIPEENLDEKGKGLWANIHAKRARGEKPNPPGHPDRPSAADLKRSQSEELHGDQHKLDHNKDNKIDKEDMKKVRKHGAVEEAAGNATWEKSFNSPRDVDGLVKTAKGIAGLNASKKGKSVTLTGPKNLINRALLGMRWTWDFSKYYVKEDTVEEKKGIGTLRNNSAFDGKQRIKDMVKKTATKQEEGILDAVSKVASNAVSGAKNMVAKRKATFSGKPAGYSEETEDSITEATFKVEVEGLPSMYIDGASAGSIKAQLRKKFKDPDAIVSIERITPQDKKKELRAKVSEEQVDEISNRAKGAYVRVAARDAAYQSSKGTSAINNNDSKDSNRQAIRNADRKRDNRLQGIDRATKGMKNEDAEAVDELSRDTLGSYISKASDASKHRGMPTKKVDNRYSGVAKASKKIDKMEEDQVEESYEDQKKHLKKVGKGGSVSYSASGKTMTGKYGGMKNKGGRSYAMVHHDTHSAMVPLPQINHK